MSNRTSSEVLSGPPVQPRKFGDSKGVALSLMLLAGILFIFPVLLIVIVLGMTRVIRMSTALILGILFIAFYLMVLYSMYLILYYYLTPLENYLLAIEKIRI
jgi:glycerol-3-phosphate acyltransferase PlsY